MNTKFLESVPPESRALIARVCLIWSLIITVWATHAALIPLLVKDLLGTADAAWWQGIFTSTTAVSGTIFCSYFGYSSDRIGRREMLVPWVVAFVIAALSVTFAEQLRDETSIYFLWIPRVVAISIPSTVLHAYAADLARGGSVVESHGLLGASFGISLLFGSLICGILASTYGRLAAFAFASGVATVASLVVFSLSPKRSASGSVSPTPFASPTTSNPAATASDAAENGAASNKDMGYHYSTVPLSSSSGGEGKTVETFMDGVRLVQRDGLLRCLIFALALLRVANVNSYFMFVLFVNYRLGWQAFDAAVSFGVIGVLGVLWQALGIRYIVQRHENVVPFLVMSLACFPILMFGYGCASTTAQMYTVAVMGSVSSVSAAILPAKISILASETGASGFALGLVGSLQNVMEIVLALFFGKLLQWAVRTYQPNDWMLGVPYFANSVVYLLALFVVLFGHRRYGKQRANWIGHHDDRLFS